MIRPTHIVVPAYRDVSLTQRCLQALDASQLPANCRITLIDDASPDPGMNAMLAEFIRQACAKQIGPSWDLLTNDDNRGFVVSVNRGMSLYPDHDVLLLNSDTEVPPGWLQRMRTAAYLRKDIGTVTPFSNCGSLASYPFPNVENSLPSGYTIGQLDRTFQEANKGRIADIPTGVGFCFFIRRDCLDDTGSFDEASFGKGYGEENDFCLRASSRGWTHVLAADCFVFHKGHGSFGEEKAARVRQAYAILIGLHSHYPRLIQRHFREDPLRPLRLRADYLRLLHQRDLRLIDDSASAGKEVEDGTASKLSLTPARHGLLEMRWQNEAEAFRLWFRLPEDHDALRKLLMCLPLADSHLAPLPLIPVLHSGPGVNAAFSLPADKECHVAEELLELVARHAYPRFTGLQAFMLASQHFIIALGMRLGESRLLQPFITLVPQSLRLRIRHWIKASLA